MKIKMLRDVKARANESGNATKIYKNGDIIDCEKDWQVIIAERFVQDNSAVEVKVDAPKETKKKAVKKKTAKKKTAKKKG